MKDKIQKLIDDFKINNCRMPNVILISFHLFYDLLDEGEEYDLNSCSIFGIRCIKVDIDHYIKVGYVEG